MLAELFTSGASLPVLFGVSFLGGLIASVSPCSLSMLPLIIGYVGGCSNQNPLKVCLQMFFFVFGTAIVFSGIGVICALTGQVFSSFLGGYFGLILAGVVLIMGLKLVGFLDFEIPVLVKELPKGQGLILYPILLGAVFALAGTPCSTPILAGIMALASLSAKVPQAVLMLFLFALGQGLILILAGVLTSQLRKIAAVSEILMKLSGVLLILVSVYLYYKIFSPFMV